LPTRWRSVLPPPEVPRRARTETAERCPRARTPVIPRLAMGGLLTMPACPTSCPPCLPRPKKGRPGCDGQLLPAWPHVPRGAPFLRAISRRQDRSRHLSPSGPPRQLPSCRPFQSPRSPRCRIRAPPPRPSHRSRRPRRLRRALGAPVPICLSPYWSCWPQRSRRALSCLWAAAEVQVRKPPRRSRTSRPRRRSRSFSAFFPTPTRRRSKLSRKVAR
jgi:hypothetical protein